MVKKLILLFFAVTLYSFEVEAQIIDEDCPFDYLPTVAFNKGSVALTKASRTALDSFANYLIYNPTCSVKLVGSNDKARAKLVQKRLAEVVEYRDGRDVRKNRIIITYATSLPTTRLTFKKTS